MRLLILLAAILLASPLYARENGNGNGPPDNPGGDHTCQGGHNCDVGGGNKIKVGDVDLSSGDVNVVVEPINPVSNAQGGSATQDQSQSQTQTQSQSVSSLSEGSLAAAANGDQTVVITEENPDDLTIRNTASAMPPSVYPSGPCMGGVSGGVGLAGFNIAGGGSKVDEDCTRREYIRLMSGMGYHSHALFMLCNSPMVLETFGSTNRCLGYNVYGAILDEDVPTVASTQPVVLGEIEEGEELFTGEQCDERSDRQFKACVTK